MGQYMHYKPVAQVTDWLVDNAARHGYTVSPVKLQQLLYYCQVWHLVYFKQPLFLEDIEGWSRGPVVRSQYQRFSDWPKNKPIVMRHKQLNLPILAQEQEKLLKKVGVKYIKRGEVELELKITNELPFKNTRQNTKFNDKGNEIVSYLDILNYYTTSEDAESFNH